MVLEKTLQSPLDCKEIKPVNPKGNKPWIFIAKTEAKAPILWPPDVKSWLIGKDPDAGKDWGQEEKGVTEDEMFGWHHWLNAHEFEQTPGDTEGQGSLACCCPWGPKESDMTEQLNNNDDITQPIDVWNLPVTWQEHYIPISFFFVYGMMVVAHKWWSVSSRILLLYFTEFLF